MTTTFTAEDLRAAYEAGGIVHAELCLEQAETQMGRDALKDVRAEFERMSKEDAKA